MALKRPKTCQIVSLDWLEDSMFKGRRLDEEPYSHSRALRRERERERRRLMVIKGLEKAVKEVNPRECSSRLVTFFSYHFSLLTLVRALPPLSGPYVFPVPSGDNKR